MDAVESAVQTADTLVQRANEHAAEVEKIEAAEHLTAEHRQELRRTARAEFEQRLGEDYRSALTRLDEAVAAATKRLRHPGDERAETAKLAAAERVSRYLNGPGPAQAIEDMSAREDVAGLRRLRDEVPSHVATLKMLPGERARTVEGLELAIDRALEPLTSGAEREAIRTRLRADEARARLQAAVEWGFSRRSPVARVKLGLAMSS